MRASGLICSRLSITMRCGWRGVSTARTVICGSSSSTVPMPVRIAQARARHQWPSSRAGCEVIHWLRPLWSAVWPSRLAAAFIRTHGRPRSMRLKNPMFISRASAAIRPLSATMPAARSLAMPCPATSGFGSSIAATTRASPASTSASAQGGVRPWWLHGSSVT